MLANAISSLMCRINRRHPMTGQSIQTYRLLRRMHRLPRRLSLRCGHLLIGWLTYSSTRSSTRGRTCPRRRPLEWFLFVSLCYLYCIDFYGHIQKLVCTICGVVVVVDERYSHCIWIRAWLCYIYVLVVLYEMCVMTTFIYMLC